MHFSREAWDRNAALYETIRAMPFNAELAAGTVTEARFRHYITQDAHCLVGFGRALALAAAKAPSPDRLVQFAKCAEVAVIVERALHGSFFQQFGIEPETFEATPLSPACHHYVSYLLATAHNEPYEVVLGALLTLFLDLCRGGAGHPCPRGAAEPLSGLDRHLCGRGVSRCRPRDDRSHRRGGQQRRTRPAGAHAHRLPPCRAARMDVLG